MINHVTGDLYRYLKGRWWGKVVIGIVCGGVLIFGIWALPASQKERLFGPGKTTSLDVQNMHFTDEELEIRNLYVGSCRPIANPPRQQYELARELEPSHRESEMANIVADAVCVGDEPYALEIFAKLTATDQKDRAAKQVVSFYITKRKFPDASRWVGFLSNTQDRDWWTRRILERSNQSKAAPLTRLTMRLPFSALLFPSSQGAGPPFVFLPD